jgi:hypothetical protein
MVNQSGQIIAPAEAASTPNGIITNIIPGTFITVSRTGASVTVNATGTNGGGGTNAPVYFVPTTTTNSAGQLIPTNQEFNVKAYGAYGDNIHYDDIAISNTIALAASVHGGVYLNGGPYLVSNANFNLRGLAFLHGDGMVRFNGGTYFDAFVSGGTSIIYSNVTAGLTNPMFIIPTNYCHIYNIDLFSATTGTNFVAFPGTGFSTNWCGIVTTNKTDRTVRVDLDNVSVRGFYIGIDEQVGTFAHWNNVYTEDYIWDGYRIDNTVQMDSGDCTYEGLDSLHIFSYPANAAIEIRGGGEPKFSNIKTVGSIIYDASTQANEFLTFTSQPASNSVITIGNTSYTNVYTNTALLVNSNTYLSGTNLAQTISFLVDAIGGQTGAGLGSGIGVVFGLGTTSNALAYAEPSPTSVLAIAYVPGTVGNSIVTTVSGSPSPNATWPNTTMLNGYNGTGAVTACSFTNSILFNTSGHADATQGGSFVNLDLESASGNCIASLGANNWGYFNFVNTWFSTLFTNGNRPVSLTNGIGSGSTFENSAVNETASPNYPPYPTNAQPQFANLTGDSYVSLGTIQSDSVDRFTYYPTNSTGNALALNGEMAGFMYLEAPNAIYMNPPPTITGGDLVLAGGGLQVTGGNTVMTGNLFLNNPRSPGNITLTSISNNAGYTAIDWKVITTNGPPGNPALATNVATNLVWQLIGNGNVFFLIDPASGDTLFTMTRGASPTANFGTNIFDAAGPVFLDSLSDSSLVMSSASDQLQSVTLGTGLSFTGSTLNASGSGIPVTGTPNTILVYDANGDYIGTNALSGLLTNVLYAISNNTGSTFSFQINTNGMYGTNSSGQTFSFDFATGNFTTAGSITLGGVSHSSWPSAGATWPSNPNQFITVAGVTNLSTNQNFATINLTGPQASTNAPFWTNLFAVVTNTGLNWTNYLTNATGNSTFILAGVTSYFGPTGWTNSAGNVLVDTTVTNALNTFVRLMGQVITNSFQPTNVNLTDFGANITVNPAGQFTNTPWTLFTNASASYTVASNYLTLYWTNNGGTSVVISNNGQIYTNGVLFTGGGSGGGSQTPLIQNVNAAQYSISNLSQLILGNNTVGVSNVFGSNYWSWVSNGVPICGFTNGVFFGSASNMVNIPAQQLQSIGNTGGGVQGNYFSGAGTGNNTLTGVNNTAVGTNALTILTSGSYNTADGANALANDITGRLNMAIGFNALTHHLYNDDNVSIGADSLDTDVQGHDNTAIGTFALYQLNGGTNDYAGGSSAGYNLTGVESNDIYIMNPGVTGESSTIRIGSPLNIKSYIYGTFNPVSGVGGTFAYQPVAGMLGFTNTPTTGYPLTTNIYYTNTFGRRLTATLNMTNSVLVGSSAIYLFQSNGTPRITMGCAFLAALGGTNSIEFNLEPGGYFASSNLTGQVNCRTNEVQLW